MPERDVREYHRPRELAEALRLLRRRDVRTAPLAGGTNLARAPRAGLSAIVDLGGLGLDYITTEPLPAGPPADPSPLRLGATATLGAVAASEAVQSVAGGLLAQAALRSASYTLREQGTVGGTLVAGEGAHPLLAALLALDAELLVWTQDERNVSIDGFLDDRARLLDRRALVVEIRVPRLAAPAGGALETVSRTPADAPIVCAAARASADRATGRPHGVRVAVGGVAPRPVRVPAAERLLEGQPVTAPLLAEVQEMVSGGVTPAGDWRGSSEYRRQMAGVLARRAAEAAWRVAERRWRSL